MSAHRPRLEKDYRDSVEIAASRYGYAHQSFMDRDETVARLGSQRYLFGIRDTGTGHIQPMKLLVGLAKQAALAGASLHEQTKALKINQAGGRVTIENGQGRHPHRSRP